MKKLIWVMLLSIAPFSHLQAAELFSDAEKQDMMRLTLENFWGRAIDSKGNPVQPKDEKERSTIPISKEQAYYLINKGGESGMAEWCGVAWKERYLLMVKQLRKNLSNDTQAAYSGVLHGVAQQMLASSLKDEICDTDTKKQIAEIMIKDVKNIKQSLNAND